MMNWRMGIIALIVLASLVVSLPSIARAPQLDVPERHIAGYQLGLVQLRSYRDAITVVFPGNMWGNGWVRTASIGSGMITVTPEPLNDLLMIAVTWEGALP